MVPRLAKWGAIAVLVAALCFLSYRWGMSATLQQAAELRQQAVEEAVRTAQERAREREAQVAAQAAAFQKSLERARESLSQRDRQLAEYEAGEEMCFDPEGLELFNSY